MVLQHGAAEVGMGGRLDTIGSEGEQLGAEGSRGKTAGSDKELTEEEPGAAADAHDKV